MFSYFVRPNLICIFKWDSIKESVGFGNKYSDSELVFAADIQGKYTTLQWKTLHIGGLYHVEEEISMSTTVPNFVGEIQQFYFNNIPYIELARALSSEQSIAGECHTECNIFKLQ